MEETVDICINKRWVTVCNDGLDTALSSTVCRQLGYSNGK